LLKTSLLVLNITFFRTAKKAILQKHVSKGFFMAQFVALLDLSTGDLLLILAILLLLFGAKKLPKLSRSIGKSANEFKNGTRDARNLRDDVRRQINETRSSLIEEQNQRQEG
jgi:sec-independent protein translocase protein TatA